MDLPPDDPTEPLAKAPRLNEPAKYEERGAPFDEPLPPVPASGAIEPISEAASPTEKLYHELLYAVARKFEGETRHQTALRYIRECEAVQGVSVADYNPPAFQKPYRSQNVGSGGEAPGSLLDA